MYIYMYRAVVSVDGSIEHIPDADVWKSIDWLTACIFCADGRKSSINFRLSFYLSLFPQFDSLDMIRF